MSSRSVPEKFNLWAQDPYLKISIYELKIRTWTFNLWAQDMYLKISTYELKIRTWKIQFMALKVRTWKFQFMSSRSVPENFNLWALDPYLNIQFVSSRYVPENFNLWAQDPYLKNSIYELKIRTWKKADMIKIE
jgi:hypothetical protein